MEVKIPAPIDYMHMHHSRIIPHMRQRIRNVPLFQLKIMLERNKNDIIEEASLWSPYLKKSIEKAQKMSSRLLKYQTRKYESQSALGEIPNVSLVIYIKLKWQQALLEEAETKRLQGNFISF